MAAGLFMKKSVLFLFESTAGFGHLRRTSALANSMVSQDVDVYAASGTLYDSENFFDSRIRTINLPAHHVYRKETSEIKAGWYYYDIHGNLVHNQDFDESTWLQSREDALTKHLGHMPIHSIVAEFWPFARERELTNLVKTVQKTSAQHGVKPLVISSIRDIATVKATENLSVAEKIEKEKNMVNIIINNVDHVLVHADEKFISFKEGFASYDQIAPKVTYTGYVMNEVKDKTSYQRQKEVIVSVGSGIKGYSLLEAAMLARPYSMLKEYKWSYICGPRLGDANADKIEELSRKIQMFHGREFHTEITRHEPNLVKRFDTAALSISQGGYNTTLEVLNSGIKRLFVPVFETDKETGELWINEEQNNRLTKLAEQGLIMTSSPVRLSNPILFAQDIDQTFSQEFDESKLDIGGAYNTAHFIYSKMYNMTSEPILVKA